MPTQPINVSDLATVFRGRLVGPSEPDYDEVRALHNGLASKRPALIARCSSTADIAAAVKFARQTGLEVAIRGGGHNVAGRASVDGGLLIDLSLMRDVSVNADARTARVQGGATWGDVNRATQAHGLATTGGIVSSTGVGGLTLGGGLGWLMGRCGLAVDNLLSAEIVTADGRVLTASQMETPDLFWAIRGGGGNFGIASSLTYQLYPIGPVVTAGVIVHPLSVAREFLAFYRKFTASVPDDLTAFAAMIHAPDGSGAKLVAAAVCHCGTPSDAARDLEPLRRFGTPALDGVGPMEYCAVNSMMDASYPKGALNYWKSSMLDDLTDEAIDATVRAFEACPSAMSQVVIEHLHGAAIRVPSDATAFAHRGGGYNLLVLGQWRDAADTDRCVRWTRDAYASLAPFAGRRRYVNYLDGDDQGDSAAFGPNYRRLQAIKAKYDPDNFFHQNQNIIPAA